MSRRALSLFTLLTGAFVTAPGVGAQLRAPKEVEFVEAFGLLSNVRELPDGRVLVADPLGQILAAVDMEAGTMDMWGREGGGPREYRQPDAVYALPGDSTLLVDLGNGRLTVIAPDGSFGRTRPIALGGGPTPGMRGGMQLLLPRVVDGDGRIYFPIRSFESPGDSTAIGRVAPDSDEVETVAKYKPAEVQRSGGGGNVRIQEVPMSSQDDWSVGEDGSVALVRADGYYVEVVHPDGRVSSGPRIDHRQIRPGDAEKQAYLDARAAAGLSVQISMTDGQRQMHFGRGGRGGGAPPSTTSNGPTACRPSGRGPPESTPRGASGSAGACVPGSPACSTCSTARGSPSVK